MRIKSIPLVHHTICLTSKFSTLIINQFTFPQHTQIRPQQPMYAKDKTAGTKQEKELL